ncbi:MAG: FAD-dependent oxidoreductase [Polyangiaceae bacterium]|nr:FAD-dependent oxidoreductase [Polyangiaceae bacterium]
MRRIKTVLAIAAFGAALSLNAPSALAQGGMAAEPVQIDASTRTSLAKDIEAAKAAHPEAFEAVKNVQGHKPEVYQKARNPIPVVGRELRRLGPSALLPMLEALAFEAPARGGATDQEWTALTVGMLEAVGVQTERGFVKVDADLRSTVPHIFAIGDVAGPPMLAHKAMHEGVQVVEHLAGRPTHPVDATFIPNCTYCQPQVASIGMTEAKAREAGYSVKVSQFPFVGVGKSVAIGETEGWVKIVSDARYGEILGATIVGPEATELIHELVLARTAELTADELVGMVHAHPTLSEAIHEAALGVDGLPLHI